MHVQINDFDISSSSLSVSRFGGTVCFRFSERIKIHFHYSQWQRLKSTVCSICSFPILLWTSSDSIYFSMHHQQGAWIDKSVEQKTTTTIHLVAYILRFGLSKVNWKKTWKKYSSHFYLSCFFSFRELIVFPEFDIVFMNMAASL